MKNPTPVTYNPVDGTKRGGLYETCDQQRLEPKKCGMEARYFKPANLDGRLAMLPQDV